MPYVRTVKTSSGATAVQIVYFSRRGSREIEHLGSAHSGAEVELLKAAALWRSRTRPPVLTSVSVRPLVLVDAATEDGPALDPLLGKVGDGVVGPGRLQLEASMGSPSVVVGLVLAQDRPQMSLAEDEHPVGDLGPGGEHESFRVSVRAGAPGRDFHRFDTSVGQDCVK